MVNNRIVSPQDIVIVPAKPHDARQIASLVHPYASRRILIAKELIEYFENIQEFLVARPSDDPTGDIIACGALHVMWDDIAEVRTIATRQGMGRRGIGSRILTALLDRAHELGLQRVFCLTFEVDFFARHGFHVIEGTPVGQDVYLEMLRSHDDGMRQFLDLASVKPNTLGNTRMLKEFS